jgi:hypothetical protein
VPEGGNLVSGQHGHDDRGVFYCCPDRGHIARTAIQGFHSYSSGLAGDGIDRCYRPSAKADDSAHCDRNLGAPPDRLCPWHNRPGVSTKTLNGILRRFLLKVDRGLCWLEGGWRIEKINNN